MVVVRVGRQKRRDRGGAEPGGVRCCAGEVRKGARGMPGLPEAKKDVASCEKPRGGASGR